MIGLLIALLAVLLLAILPLGVGARYHQEGLRVFLIVGPLQIMVYPRKKKKAARPKKSGKVTQSEKKSEAKKSDGKLSDFIPLVHRIVDFLGDLRRKLRIERLELKLILAGDDPCDLALNYGRVWSAVGNLFPLLERCFVIKNRDIDVICDFDGEEIRVACRADITITLARIFSLGIRHGFHVLREYMKIMKLRKGGAGS